MHQRPTRPESIYCPQYLARLASGSDGPDSPSTSWSALVVHRFRCRPSETHRSLFRIDSVQVEQVTGSVAHHGEGPIWDSALGQLVWVDLLRGDILFTVPGSPIVERFHVSAVAACVVPRVNAGWAVATERGFALVDDQGMIEYLPDIWTDATVRMNDGGCDPEGRFYCGSMAYDAQHGRGALYRLDPNRSIHTVFSGVTVSNGIAWSPNGALAYYVDSPTRCVDVCTADLRDRRPFVQIPAETGMPDGLTVDAEGGIWVAIWGGGAVHRYAPDGKLDEVINLKVRQPTSCAFGGKGLDTLFITTSAQNLKDPEPEAGALFAVQPGVRGLSPHLYAG
jgi:sugar lactone lactonase YvrE